MLSAQALAFDVDGLSYNRISGTDVEVTGRASGNTDTDIVIPATISFGFIYDVATVGARAFYDNAVTSLTVPARCYIFWEFCFPLQSPHQHGI